MSGHKKANSAIHRDRANPAGRADAAEDDGGPETPTTAFAGPSRETWGLRPTAKPNADASELLNAEEVGAILRTSRKAIYTMAERRLIPGAVRIGRRLLFRRHDLLDWLRQKSASSLERSKR